MYVKSTHTQKKFNLGSNSQDASLYICKFTKVRNNPKPKRQLTPSILGAGSQLQSRGHILCVLRRLSFPPQVGKQTRFYPGYQRWGGLNPRALLLEW